MTENEKAATFIGWKLEDAYMCACGHPDSKHRGTWSADHYCESCRCDYYAPTPAPDMSDPRNYMKANVEWAILTRYPSWTALPIGKASPRGYGKTPVEALAALYDAEEAARSKC